MRSRWLVPVSAGLIGAGLMYYLDPDRGRRRRSLVGDQVVHAGHRILGTVDKTERDIRNRVRGAFASLRALVGATMPEDRVLAERVRARIGRAVSHPGSIEVTARKGLVTLSGPVLEREVEQLIRRVRSAYGVKEIENRLEEYEAPGRIPGLQGRVAPRAGERGAFRQANWSPAARATGGAAGAYAAIYGVSRGGPLGAVWAVAGLLLLARAATSLELRRLTGIGVPRRAIDVQKTIHIDAPPERVFAVWADFENFPTFMRHVRRVRRIDDGRQGVRWRWTVDGPVGAEVEFDAEVTVFDADRLIAWRTEPASTVQHVGRARFIGNPDGSTTVEVTMSSNPVAGALGHAVARLFGADPKHLMDDDLVRLKTYLETGKPPHDAAVQVQREQAGT